MRTNVAIVLVSAAIVVLVWAVAVRDTSTAAERGAKRYCTALQEHGVLFEPFAQCLREYEARGR